VLALGLAAVGIYGVISQAVTQRTREIGIRMALGARREDVRRLILGESLRLVAIGSLIGVGVALALGRLIAGLLYGISPYDVLTYLGVTVVAGATAVLATYLPVRRAVRVNPIIALRHE
jgi:ABC-type antimicrobial peptide transport system permease subunit